MNKLDRNDYDLIEAFESAAKILAPHHDEMHKIDTDQFMRGGLDLCDITDYFRIHHSDWFGGMAEIIGATIDIGLDYDLGEEE